MGVKQLWPLLQGEGILEKMHNLEDLQGIVQEVDGKVVAVDLAMWMVQADQQLALLPHFSREERCVKVAFERALQWLRHGCVPVVVVEGRAPEEKRGAQAQRFAQRNGYTYAGAGGGGGVRGGGSQGPSQFTRLGMLVASVLEALGLPVFFAPGEAEAVCAALAQAGCVDGCATFDSDVLLYGAETVYQTLRLSTTDPKSNELVRCSMGSVRSALGIHAGGPAALSVIAMVAGCDYDLDGAQGVGSIGGLTLAQHLLQGEQDDRRVLERLAELLSRPADARLQSLDKCTGCTRCGHEGGRKGKVKRHTRQHPCPLCPPSEDGCCAERPGARCGCAFHSTERERRAERIAERVRRDPGFLAEAEAVLGVFERQGREAAEYVVRRLQELRLPLGQRLPWLRRPSVSSVREILEARCPGLLWDLPTLRSKMLPVLMEWDLEHLGPQAEFAAAEVQKVHGQKGKADDGSGAHWRYVLKWERSERDEEGLCQLQVRPKRPRAKAGAGAAAGAGPCEEEEAAEEEGALFSQPTSQPSAHGSQAHGSQQQQQQQQHWQQQRWGGWGMDLATQAEPTGEGLQEEPAPVPMSVPEFDRRWLKDQSAEHRAVRQSAVRRLCPALVAAFQDRLSGRGTKPPKASAAKSAAKAAAGGGAKKAGTAGASTPGGGGHKSGRARARATATVAAAAGGERDILELFSQAAPAVVTGAKGAPPPRRYGLGPSAAAAATPAAATPAAAAAAAQPSLHGAPKAGRPAAGAAARQQAGTAGRPAAAGAGRAAGVGTSSGAGPPSAAAGQHLPTSPRSMLSLLNRVLGPSPAPAAAGPHPSAGGRARQAAAAPAAAAAAAAAVPAAAGEIGRAAGRPPQQQAQQAQQAERAGPAGATAADEREGAGGGMAAFESPRKKSKSLPPSPSDRGSSDGFEVLLSSPESPALQPLAARLAPLKLPSAAATAAGRQLFSAPPSPPQQQQQQQQQGRYQHPQPQQQQQQQQTEEEEGREEGQGEGEEMGSQVPPPAQRRPRSRAQRGRGGGSAGLAAGAPSRNSDSSGGEAQHDTQHDAQQGQRAQQGQHAQQPRADSPAKGPTRGRAALRLAASHATDIRGFLHQPAAQHDSSAAQGGLGAAVPSSGGGAAAGPAAAAAAANRAGVHERNPGMQPIIAATAAAASAGGDKGVQAEEEDVVDLLTPPGAAGSQGPSFAGGGAAAAAAAPGPESPIDLTWESD